MGALHFTLKVVGKNALIRSRPGKPNQRKGQNEKFMNFAHFCDYSGVFSLGKQARFTNKLLFRNAPVKSSWTDLSLVWFAGATPDLKKKIWALPLLNLLVSEPQAAWIDPCGLQEERTVFPQGCARIFQAWGIASHFLRSGKKGEEGGKNRKQGGKEGGGERRDRGRKKGEKKGEKRGGKEGGGRDKEGRNRRERLGKEGGKRDGGEAKKGPKKSGKFGMEERPSTDWLH